MRKGHTLKMGKIFEEALCNSAKEENIHMNNMPKSTQKYCQQRNENEYHSKILQCLKLKRLTIPRLDKYMNQKEISLLVVGVQ